MTINDWAHQYAIMMPNGEIYCRPVQVAAPEETGEVEDFSVSSVERDMAAYAFGAMWGRAKPTVIKLLPLIFEKREDADKKCAELAETAAGFGVTLWGGRVVERLCTPFTSNDPAREFTHQIVDWLTRQGETQ